MAYLAGEEPKPRTSSVLTYGDIYGCPKTKSSSGPQGSQGAAGPQGNQGEVGPQGEAGAQGNQGEVGPQGSQGEVGAQGNQGEVGPQGNQGVAGPQGNQGEVGPQGVAGPQGNQGEVGPQGVAGPQGNQGDIGPQGVAGPQGNQGDIGPQGVAGAQGNQGVAGAQGNQGVAGPQGNQGDIGPQGNQGAVGPQGPPGATGTGENFRVALGSDYTYSGTEEFQEVPAWTSVVDPVWTDTFSGNLYLNLTLGSLDLSSGRFTCGVAGAYSISVTNYQTVGIGQYTVAVNQKLMYGSVGTSQPYNNTLISQGSLFLNPGDVVSVVARNVSFPYTVDSYLNGGLNQSPNLIWSLALTGGVASGTPGGPSESFQVILETDFVYTGPGVEIMGPWTNIINPVDFPSTSPSYAYVRLTSGTLNLATGIFQVGVSGVYACVLNGFSGQILVNGKFLTTNQNPNPCFVVLVAGDLVWVGINQNAPYLIPEANLDQTSAPACFWGMALQP